MVGGEDNVEGNSMRVRKYVKLSEDWGSVSEPTATSAGRASWNLEQIEGVQLRI